MIWPYWRPLKAIAAFSVDILSLLLHSVVIEQLSIFPSSRLEVSSLMREKLLVFEESLENGTGVVSLLTPNHHKVTRGPSKEGPG